MRHGAGEGALVNGGGAGEDGRASRATIEGRGPPYGVGDDARGRGALACARDKGRCAGEGIAGSKLAREVLNVLLWVKLIQGYADALTGLSQS